MNDFGRFFVGFDRVASQLENIANQSAAFVKNNYPPFNIKKVSENKYAIELALAGFTKKDIDIELLDGKLIISGQLATESDQSDFIWRGISSKAFTRQFAITDGIEVKNAEMLNGILRVWLESVATDKSAKKIPIDGEDNV